MSKLFKREDEIILIEKNSGAQRNACNCQKCVDMCKKYPCIGTPSDIMRLIEAGYLEHIKDTGWAVGVPYGLPVIDMFQIRAASKNEYGHESCPLLQNGLCQLHDKGLKPVEGVLASCTDQFKLEKGKYPATWVTALTWNMKENEEIISEIRGIVWKRDAAELFNTMEKERSVL